MRGRLAGQLEGGVGAGAGNGLRNRCEAGGGTGVADETNRMKVHAWEQQICKSKAYALQTI